MTSFMTWIDSPVSWAIAGFAIGIALGVNTLSAWLVTAGLAGFIAYLVLHGQAEQKTEGRLFAACGSSMISWLVGFIVHGQIF